MSDLYFVGKSVIGYGDKCIRYGDKIPSWLSKERVEALKKRGFIKESIGKQLNDVVEKTKAKFDIKETSKKQKAKIDGKS